MAYTHVLSRAAVFLKQVGQQAMIAQNTLQASSLKFSTTAHVHAKVFLSNKPTSPLKYFPSGANYTSSATQPQGLKTLIFRAPLETKNAMLSSFYSGQSVQRESIRRNILDMLRPRNSASLAVVRPPLSGSTRGLHGSALQKFYQGGGGGWGRGGWGRSRWMMDDGTQVLYALMGVNLLVFMAWRTLDQSFMMRNFTVSPHALVQGRLHTLLTSTISHAQLSHLLANMLGLYFFGGSVASYLGGRVLLQLYFAGGLTASLCQVMYQMMQTRSDYGYSRPRSAFRSIEYFNPALGASGAVNSLVLFEILLFPRKTILLYFVIPMPAAVFGVFFLLRDFMGAYSGSSNVAHAAHLGGATVGGAAWLWFKYRTRGRF